MCISGACDPWYITSTVYSILGYDRYTCTVYVLYTLLQDVLSELQTPCHTVGASRRIPVVQYSFSKAIRPYTAERQGLLSKCTAINGDMAKKLLDHGYKHLSKFKNWCPVEVCTSLCVLKCNHEWMHKFTFTIVVHVHTIHMLKSYVQVCYSITTAVWVPQCCFTIQPAINLRDVSSYISRSSLFPLIIRCKGSIYE